MTNRKKALLGASATIAVWATAFPFSKIALQSVDSLTLSVARVMGGALLMLVIGVVKGLHIPTTWREWGLYILLGATGNFVYQVVFNEGLRTIPAATSSIIMALTPMTTALMAMIVYKDKIRPHRLVIYNNSFYRCSHNYSLEFNPYNSYRCIMDFAGDDTLCSL